MPKRPRRKKSSRPPPAGRSGTTAKAKAPKSASASGATRQLLYKVVELSTVDEHHLERTINEWVPKGWTLDGVQFAMRESSKRPSMAFVFFTREGVAAEVDPRASRSDLEGREGEGLGGDETDHASTANASAAHSRLHRLAGVPVTAQSGGVRAPVPSVAQPDPNERAYEGDAGSLQPYREFDAGDLERLSSTDHLPRDVDERTWPDRPERATDPWARLHALANAPDDEDDEGSQP